MDEYICPFCNTLHYFSKLRKNIEIVNFDRITRNGYDIKHSSIDNALTSTNSNETLCIKFIECNNPSCNKISVTLVGHGDNVKDLKMPILPNSLAKYYPDCIPVQIMQDYKEAYAILPYSPRASATLARRCIQGMIRDFWKISKPKLVDEISYLKDKIPNSLFEVLNSVRQLGNIGAHPENDIDVIVDINQAEAEKVLRILDLLIKDWYVAKYEQEILINEINDINQDKQEERKS